MKITMITGSAHKNGTSAYLAEQFVRGAVQSGHEVSRFDTAFMDIHPCIGCGHCRRNDGKCVFQDDMNQINMALIEADAVVFVSPIYYCDINGQLKITIDRFYANNSAIQTPKKAALLLTSADEEWDVTAGAICTYKGICNYLGWSDEGIIAAGGCGVLDDIKQTNYPEKAYSFGRNFGA